jgi:hypothetical protein
MLHLILNFDWIKLNVVTNNMRNMILQLNLSLYKYFKKVLNLLKMFDNFIKIIIICKNSKI